MTQTLRHENDQLRRLVNIPPPPKARPRNYATPDEGTHPKFGRTAPNAASSSTEPKTPKPPPTSPPRSAWRNKGDNERRERARTMNLQQTDHNLHNLCGMAIRQQTITIVSFTIVVRHSLFCRRLLCSRLFVHDCFCSTMWCFALNTPTRHDMDTVGKRKHGRHNTTRATVATPQ